MMKFSFFQQVAVAFLVACISTNIVLASALFPTEDNSLGTHLVEVNQEWRTQQGLSAEEMLQQTHFESDIERIQTHLKLVEQVLRQRNTTHLNKEQLNNRNQLLDVLNTYWKAATFPTNLYHAHRQPYFVDHKDIHCAVGYLLQQSGETELVQQIRKTDNYAYIRELLKYPALQKWADKQGFTVEELAWIQPTYSPNDPAVARTFTTVGNGGGVNGTIYTMHQNLDSTVLYLGGHFGSVDGQLANGIIAWDGTNWQTMGNGLYGEIHAMEHFQNQLVVGGSFSLNGSPCNLAKWSSSTNTWIALQSGDMQGTVYALKSYGGRLYAGGDFQVVDGQPMPNIAHMTSFSTGWSNQSAGINSVPNAFSVNDVVRCFEVVANQLLVGGDFTQTANLTTDSTINHLTAKHLAYWDGFNWTSSLNGLHREVKSVLYHNGSLYIGALNSMSYPMTIYTAGVWNYIDGYNFTPGINIFNRFVVHNNEVYAVGQFYVSPFVGYYGRNILKVLGFNGVEGVALIDSEVSTAFSFKGEMYLAGTFDQINSIPGFNRLAVSTLIPTSTTSIEKESSTIQIRYSSEQVFVQYEQLKQDAILQLFNANGQLLQNMTLPSGTQTIPLETTALSKGMYFYQVQVENRKESGKIVLF